MEEDNRREGGGVVQENVAKQDGLTMGSVLTICSIYSLLPVGIYPSSVPLVPPHITFPLNPCVPLLRPPK